MSIVYTIGYEGVDIDRFIVALKGANIELLADVRAVAISRKKGFSKAALRFRLELEGIRYDHFVELGDPKVGRIAAREGRFSEFRKIYNKHLDLSQPTLALNRLAKISATYATCLMCFEQNPTECHRTIVTGRLARHGFTCVDLDAGASRENGRGGVFRAGFDSRQGFATA